MTSYHHAAYTLDPNQTIEDDTEKVAPAAGVGGPEDDFAAEVKELHDKRKADQEAEDKARAERDQEWAERDPKPLPSELLQERGEPAPDENEDKSQATTGVGESAPPDGTVQEVLDWAGDDQNRIRSALNAERAGQNRSSLISELERRQA